MREQLAHIAAALQALRDPETETAEQTIALNKAIELLQAPTTDLSAGADAPAAALAPTIDPEALDSAIAAAMLIYVGSDDFKTKLADAIKSTIGEDDDEAEKARIDGAVKAYLASEDGVDLMLGDFAAFLKNDGAKEAIKAAVADLDLGADDVAAYFATDAGKTALTSAVDKQLLDDLGDPETPLGKLTVGLDDLAAQVKAMNADSSAADPAPGDEVDPSATLGAASAEGGSAGEKTGVDRETQV